MKLLRSSVEIEASVKDGAREIDIVITREHVLTGNWRALFQEMRDFRAACSGAHVKAILATGDLKTLRNVAKASMVCMMAGADFIKTSTGKEKVNARKDWRLRVRSKGTCRIPVTGSFKATGIR